MPRSARLDAPGVLHHIIIRGIERRKIFRNDHDRDNLLDRLALLLPETETSCYAWALMPNHAHFLFRSGRVGISHLMRRLLTGYAVYFNRKYRRHGQLFQNRYKSIICQEDAYFKELVRYIHLNPLRAKIVEDINGLNKFPYSGHSVIMGNQKNDGFDTKYVLSYFSKSVSGAKRAYLAFVANGVDQGRRPELVGGGLIRSLGGWESVKHMRLSGQDRMKGDERILGDSEFVTKLLSKANERIDRRYLLRQSGFGFNKIVAKVSELFDIDETDLFARGRRKNQVEARDLLCFWAVEELGITRTSVAKKLGMSQPGVGYAVSRGRKMARQQGYCLD